MAIFREQGEATTREATRIALEAAVRLDAPLLAATTSGRMAALALRMAQEAGEAARLRIIAHAYGTRIPGQNAMLPEHREALVRAGVSIVFAAHALSGVERGLSTKFSGIYSAELIAHTLRRAPRWRWRSASWRRMRASSPTAYRS